MKKKSLTGFTLIELLVYIAVLSIVGVAAASLLLWALSANTKAQLIKEVAQSSKVAMDVMIREIRESESVYTPTTTQSQLSLETLNSPPPGETSAYVDFFLCNTRLCVKREGQDPVALTPETIEVSGLVFTPVATDTDFPSVSILMEARAQNPNNRPEREAVLELRSTASIR